MEKVAEQSWRAGAQPPVLAVGLALIFGSAVLPSSGTGQGSELVEPSVEEPAAEPAQTAPSDAAAEPVRATALSAPSSAARAPEQPMDYARALRTLQLREQVAALRATNREWAAPAVFFGLGVTSLLFGGILLATSREDTDSWDQDVEAKTPRRRAGLALMPLGALLVVVNLPMFILRRSRDGRLGRAEDALRRLAAGSESERGGPQPW